MRAAAALLALALLHGCRREEPVESAPPRIELSFLGDFHRDAGEELDSDDVGGISALAYSPERMTWLALSDSRIASRFFELDVRFDESSEHLSVSPREVFRLTTENGGSFDEDVLDPEGMVQSPWGSLLVATECDTRKNPVEQAKLLEFDFSGRLERSFALPEKFLVSGTPPVSGLRHNLAFESLTLSPDGSRLFLGAEGALLQDGPAAGFEEAGFSRIVVYRVADRELSFAAEHVYALGPFVREEGFTEQEVSGGLVELVAVANDRLLALERIFIRELSDGGRDVTRVRIYDVDLTEATDVKDVDSLASHRDWRPVRKELVLDLDDVLLSLAPDYPRLDNLEAMGVGPELPGGGRALLLASDDNFRATQRTQFLLFRWKGI